jgi:hypothetical protein
MDQVIDPLAEMLSDEEQSAKVEDERCHNPVRRHCPRAAR